MDSLFLEKNAPWLFHQWLSVVGQWSVSISDCHLLLSKECLAAQQWDGQLFSDWVNAASNTSSDEKRWCPHEVLYNLATEMKYVNGLVHLWNSLAGLMEGNMLSNSFSLLAGFQCEMWLKKGSGFWVCPCEHFCWEIQFIAQKNGLCIQPRVGGVRDDPIVRIP